MNKQNDFTGLRRRPLQNGFCLCCVGLVAAPRGLLVMHGPDRLGGVSGLASPASVHALGSGSCWLGKRST